MSRLGILRTRQWNTLVSFYTYTIDRAVASQVVYKKRRNATLREELPGTWRLDAMYVVVVAAASM